MLFSITAVTALAAMAMAAVTPGMTVDERHNVRRSLSGQATFYGGNVQGGMCSFNSYTLPAGLPGTALSSSNWDNAGNCGGCVNVHHNGKSVTAMIVDQCPGCGTNHLDLFPTAFDDLAAASEGIIDVTWSYVPCPHISGPLEIHMDSGVSQYWWSANVVNANRRTSSLHVSIDQGKTWKAVDRNEDNWFVIASGTGTTSVWVKATSYVGTEVIVQNVPVTAGATKQASSNYS